MFLRNCVNCAGGTQQGAEGVYCMALFMLKWNKEEYTFVSASICIQTSLEK